MSSPSSPDCSEPEHVLFKDRPEWSDVIPIVTCESLDSPCYIIYGRQYEDAISYFRAILSSGEKSPRVMELLNFIVNLNPSLYTAWRYRYDCLIELDADLHKELEFVYNIAIENPKNYQLWGHRRLVSDLVPDGDRELRFSDALLTKDSKNYHAWSYRVYIVKKYNLWEEELKNTCHFIERDVWNNSAWSQRYYVYKHLHPASDVFEPGDEIDYVVSKMPIHADNPSPYVYCQGLLKLYGKSLSAFPRLEETIMSLSESDLGKLNSLAFLIDHYTNMKVKLDKVVGMINTMIRLDKVRMTYWISRKDEMLSS